MTNESEGLSVPVSSTRYAARSGAILRGYDRRNVVRSLPA